MKVTNETYRQPVHAEQTVKPSTAKAEEKAAETKATTDVVEISGKKQETVENTYTPPKKLSQDQLRGIKDMLSAQQAQMLQNMAGNTTNQANSFMRSIGGATSNNSKQDADAFWKKSAAARPGSELPPTANTPEGALADISPGGAYSVDAVASRIFDMAISMAGDDPKMLEKMRTAVIKGFEAAGVEFKQNTGKGLPGISTDTYNEVMKRFDEKAAELNGKTK